MQVDLLCCLRIIMREYGVLYKGYNIACDDLDFLAKQNHTYDIIYCMDQAISTSSSWDMKY